MEVYYLIRIIYGTLGYYIIFIFYFDTKLQKPSAAIIFCTLYFHKYLQLKNNIFTQR